MTTRRRTDADADAETKHSWGRIGIRMQSDRFQAEVAAVLLLLLLLLHVSEQVLFLFLLTESEPKVHSQSRGTFRLGLPGHLGQRPSKVAVQLLLQLPLCAMLLGNPS